MVFQASQSPSQLVTAMWGNVCQVLQEEIEEKVETVKNPCLVMAEE
jgi:hypothetical protein